MKLPVISRLRVDEFPDQKDWISRLFGPLNSFLEYTYLALTNGLTFYDNFTGFESTIDFTYQGASDFPLYLANPRKFIPKALQVAQGRDNGTATILLFAWEPTDDGRIRILEMNVVSAGATAAPTVGQRYQATLRFTP